MIEYLTEDDEMNYQLEMDKVLEGLGGRRPGLLLHACCAPCSSYVLEYLTRYFDITVFFYNPNIMPAEEYDKRLAALRKLLAVMPCADGVRLVEQGRDAEAFIEAARGTEYAPEGGARCPACFELRLGKTAELCREGGFDYFTTTLTISPHKNAELINKTGMECAARTGTVWLPCDFKKRNGYLRSIELCREYGIYRQSWCGCSFAREAVTD